MSKGTEGVSYQNTMAQSGCSENPCDVDYSDTTSFVPELPEEFCFQLYLRATDAMLRAMDATDACLEACSHGSPECEQTTSACQEVDTLYDLFDSLQEQSCALCDCTF